MSLLMATPDPNDPLEAAGNALLLLAGRPTEAEKVAVLQAALLFAQAALDSWADSAPALRLQGWELATRALRMLADAVPDRWPAAAEGAAYEYLS